MKNQTKHAIVRRRASRPVRYLSLICIGVIAPAVQALAASLPDAGSLLRQEQELQQRGFLPRQSPSIQPETAPVRRPAANETIVHVKAFRFEGRITRFSETELQGVVAQFVNKDASFADLQRAADLVTAQYRKNGYLVARAYLPKQDITNGIITIAVTEGLVDRVRGVKIDGANLRLNQSTARQTIESSVRPGEPLRQADLERGLLLLNDLPGITATANLQPGTAPGTTTVAAEINEAPPVNFLEAVDNFGSRYTGGVRSSSTLNLNDVEGRGDQFSANYTASFDGGTKMTRFGYLAPVGTSGLKLGAAYSGLQYRVGKEMELLDARGHAEDWTLNARYPLIRSRLTNLYLTGSWDAKQLYGEALGAATSDEHVRVWNGGANWDHTDAKGNFAQANLSATSGWIDLSEVPGSLAQDQAPGGPHANGHYTKLNYGSSWLYRNTQKTNLLLSMSGQLAQKNLDSSEKFMLGGPTGVRAYPSGEASGDDGVKATVEGHYIAATGTAAGNVELAGFYDWGWIRQNHDAAGVSLATPNAYQLQGIGLGVNLITPKHELRLSWAHALGANPGAGVTGANSDGTTAKNHVWLIFSANL